MPLVVCRDVKSHRDARKFQTLKVVENHLLELKGTERATRTLASQELMESANAEPAVRALPSTPDGEDAVAG
ncbi:hypothetical protein [Nonomuraea harbinensis]|uniref:Uncharacterized protein n=1 Tax=Nonomuraea harbinensis TaxID=1286938 RepID=A0ABW1C5N1_9ACTN|nr:hypothetical protein [Nonomuraea harbinensis]